MSPTRTPEGGEAAGWAVGQRRRADRADLDNAGVPDDQGTDFEVVGAPDAQWNIRMLTTGETWGWEPDGWPSELLAPAAPSPEPTCDAVCPGCQRTRRAITAGGFSWGTWFRCCSACDPSGETQTGPVGSATPAPRPEPAAGVVSDDEAREAVYDWLGGTRTTFRGEERVPHEVVTAYIAERATHAAEIARLRGALGSVAVECAEAFGEDVSDDLKGVIRAIASIAAEGLGVK